MDQIKHVVYLMLENRSFDNLLGWLYHQEAPLHLIANGEQKNDGFYGLNDHRDFNFMPDGTKEFVSVTNSACDDIPNPGPGEGYKNINMQLFSQRQEPPEHTPPTMDGFITDYAASAFRHKTPTPEDLKQIMQTHSPEQLSVINGLARNFAVSDYWFSSVPSLTLPNRAFAGAGTSLGYVSNHFRGSKPIPKQLEVRTFWDVLYSNGYTQRSDWLLYENTISFKDVTFPYSLTNNLFNLPGNGHNISTIEKFYQQAEAGTLPSISFIEPELLSPFFDQNGTSYHPPAEVSPGERFVKKVYDALVSNKQAWQKTLFIITFDEHGGCYDHIAPPWGASPPWGDKEPPYTLENDFKFNRFGVRVPTIFVSPWINERTVIRSLTQVPFDHTSVIATLLEWKKIPKSTWNLGERVKNAPTFEWVCNRKSAREVIPEINLSAYCHDSLNKPTYENRPVSKYQLMLAHAMLRSVAHARGAGNNKKVDDIELDDSMMMHEAVLMIKKFLHELHSHEDV